MLDQFEKKTTSTPPPQAITTTKAVWSQTSDRQHYLPCRPYDPYWEDFPPYTTAARRP